MSYEEQLKDRRWWITRQVILLRDNEQCTRCGSCKNLQVHHLYYIPGNFAWEYPFDALVTLCKVCHEVTHGKLTDNSRTHTIQPIRNIMINLVENLINSQK